MALRPTELQLIFAATRDIEKIQQGQQQLPRWQQEQLAIQFSRELEQRKHQAQSLSKARESFSKKIELSEEKQKERYSRRKKNAALKNKLEPPLERKNGQKIDLLI